MPPDSARDRTRLSWRRTTLSGTVVAVLLLRLSLLHHNSALATVTAALTGLCWVALLVLVQRRIVALRGLGGPAAQRNPACSAAWRADAPTGRDKTAPGSAAPFSLIVPSRRVLVLTAAACACFGAFGVVLVLA